MSLAIFYLEGIYMDTQEKLWYVNLANDPDASDLLRRPSMYNYYQDQIDKFESQEELQNQILNQIQELNYLGQDFISGNDSLITDDFLVSILDYINEKVFSITYIDIIFDDRIRLRSLGKSIYKILYVDFVNETFKLLARHLKLKSPEDIFAYSDEEIKKSLIVIFTDLNKQATTLAKINPTVTESVIKYSQAIDMLDSDLSDFKDNFLTPVVEKYSTILMAQLI